MTQSFNPYLPSYEYIPDGEPHIFGDRVYVYGSHDLFNGTDYCQGDYVCWSAPLSNLKEWRFEGEIYSKTQHPHKEERLLLFAPDVVQGIDGKYYLYYSMAHSSRMSVAVCDTPAGRYEYLGDMKTEDGEVYGLKPGEYCQFDPGVFMDDDEEHSIYMYSGFCSSKNHMDSEGRLMPGCHAYKLKHDMMTIERGPMLVLGRDFPCPEGAAYFEAPSMKKINGKYHLIYSTRGDGLHYAVSDYPDKDFVYAGRIHSTSDVGLRGYTVEESCYANGNTHGSLIELNGQYYIFDHRLTNNTSYSRQGVVEPIYMDENGKFIQAESTSMGFNGAPFVGEGEYSTHIACIVRNINRMHFETKEEKTLREPMHTQDGEDRECDPNQHVGNVQDGSMIGFKYFDLKHSSKLIISVRGKAKGTFFVTTDMDYKDLKVNDYNICGQFQLDVDSQDWTEVAADMDLGEGVKPILFMFQGEGKFDFRSFEII